jgi:hypothetical protein
MPCPRCRHGRPQSATSPYDPEQAVVAELEERGNRPTTGVAPDRRAPATRGESRLGGRRRSAGSPKRRATRIRTKDRTRRQPSADQRAAPPSTTPKRYQVTVSLHGKSDATLGAAALAESFSRGAAEPMPSAVVGLPSSGEVEIEFSQLSAPTGGHGDQNGGAPANGAFRDRIVVPVLRTLLAVEDAEQRAQLGPLERVTLRLEPQRRRKPRWDELQEL